MRSLVLAMIAFSCVLDPVVGVAQEPTFSSEQLQLPGKKGACFALRPPGHWQGGCWDTNLPRTRSLRPYWNYSWGSTRVDYIGAHWYGGGSFENFKAKMRRIYEKYGRRPLLITEFAVADWKAKSPAANRHRPAKRV
jgi:hypothetical protein